MQLYAQVIVDVNHSNLDKVFEYSIPQALKGITIGHRVLVPFGQGNKPIEGFVVDISTTAAYDVSKLKSIIRPMEEYSVLMPDQIELAKHIVARYNCLMVDALRLMIPAQLRTGQVSRKLIRTAAIILNKSECERALTELTAKSGKCKAPVQKRLLETLLPIGEASVSELNELIEGAAGALSAMAKKGWVEFHEREELRRPYRSVSENVGLESHVATEQQSEIISRIINSIDDRSAISGSDNKFILRGVTGSGKTEVYMQCISHCLKNGLSAIMLVPEISLTPQTVERFRSRFGEKVAVLHSRLSFGERYDEWRRIRLGSALVAVGARSAIFAPFENIGLIAIDEEHESSYQSERTPRYSAYDVALKRCEQHGAALLLGSATPSIETWYRAHCGELTFLTLSERINKKPLPKVEIVDMREELAQGNRGMFSLKLYQYMKECYLSGRQMILFLNRRGYSTFVSCRGCGYVISCASCDVSMTYHRNESAVRCHYCGASRPIPAKCPACGQPYLKHFGVGTQQVEENVKKLFPGIRTLRMDYDTTQKKDAHLNILQAFSSHEADVLIGTQMIAKGLDFPQVTLVGVVAADTTLHVPDFRSAERAFQLITQVAGRAGRDKEAGRVVVQTYTPKHPSILFSARHDYISFYDYEIECRRMSEFPPFADFVRFLFSGEDDETTAKQCADFRVELESSLREYMATFGMKPDMLRYISSHAAPMRFMRGLYRHQLIIKLIRNADSESLLNRIGAFAREKRNAGLETSMEINPQNMT